LQALDAVAAEEIVVLERLDGDAVVAAARELERRLGRFDHVIALSEFDLETGARIRAELGVQGASPRDIRRVRDKVAMKRHVAAAGIRVPRFVPAASAETVRGFAAEVGLPVVLKPRDSAASQGVVVAESRDELEAALASVDLARYECEEYIAGDVFQLDGIVAADRLLAMRPARCINTDLAFARGERVGSVLNDDAELESRLRAFTARVLAALRLHTGAFHLEVFRVPADGLPGGYDLVFLEIGARVGGAQISYMWRDLYGVDLNDAWIRLQLGETVTLPALDASSPVGGFLLVPEPPGGPWQVAATRSLAGSIPELYLELLPPVGTILDGRGGYDDIAGRFRFRGDSSAQVEAAIRRAMREYTFAVRPVPEPARVAAASG
jgi:hypothetical protein